MTLTEMTDLLISYTIRRCQSKGVAAKQLGLSSRTITNAAARAGLAKRKLPQPLAISLGQVNYESWSRTGNGLHPLTGEALPTWEQLSEVERWHWEDGATAVAAVNLLQLLTPKAKQTRKVPA